MLYHLMMLLKFTGVTLYSGGLVARFVSSNVDEQNRAVHRIASPGLLLTWVTGAAMAELLSTPLSELWIAGGLCFSFLSQAGLVIGLGRERKSPLTVALAALPLLVVLVLMVFRPTWASVRQ